MSLASTNGSPSPTGSPHRVALVVEDEILVRQNLAQSLEDSGYSVLEADTAERAIAVCRSGRPIDVLLTDINLAGGLASGWDVAEAFRAARPGIAVVYTSGNTADHSRCVPGSRFFSKPYRVSDIVDACRGLPKHCAALPLVRE